MNEPGILFVEKRNIAIHPIEFNLQVDSPFFGGGLGNRG